MKKLVAIVAVIAIVFTSCSKTRMNKKLDGTWDLLSIDGVDAVQKYDPYGNPTGDSYTYAFKRDKTKGTYVITQKTKNSTITSSGKYVIEEVLKPKHYSVPKNQYKVVLTDDANPSVNEVWITSGMDAGNLTATVQPPAGQKEVVLKFHINHH